MATARLRMFAGPNGSGKSTLNSLLPDKLLGVYLNADEIERSIRERGKLVPLDFGVTCTGDEILGFLRESSFLKKVGLQAETNNLIFRDDCLRFGAVAVNSYHASVLSDFLRQKLLAKRESFTMETVMSHKSKVEMLKNAQALGCRTYLYFIATDDPQINISRVKNRVQLGGHPVPKEKIEARYHRSLDLLYDAIRCTNRAYIFNNSGEKNQESLIAEVTGGGELELKTDQVAAWFQRSVLDKISPKKG